MILHYSPRKQSVLQKLKMIFHRDPTKEKMKYKRTGALLENVKQLKGVTKTENAREKERQLEIPRKNLNCKK